MGELYKHKPTAPTEAKNIPSEINTASQQQALTEVQATRLDYVFYTTGYLMDAVLKAGEKPLDFVPTQILHGDAVGRQGHLLQANTFIKLNIEFVNI